MYVERTLEKHLLRVSSQFPALMVTGARQVGKTTLLRHLVGDEREYVSLDDPVALELARTDAPLFFQRYRPPLLIDEIQYAPELLPQIKLLVDESGEPGQFWMTGSQQFQLMQNVSESLAGRVAIVQLLGFSRAELEGDGRSALPFFPGQDRGGGRTKKPTPVTLDHVFKRIWRGSYPFVARDDSVDWGLFYKSYVQTYLQRDVRDLTRVGDELAFLRFLRASAARTGQLLNLSDLARDADVAVNTAKHWLSILQASSVVHLLEPYHSNVTKRLVKTPKLYFLDTGLCAHLTEWSSPETLERGAMSGAIFETWIVTELLKSFWHNGKNPPFYYYRDKDKREIDLLLAQDGTIFPVEIKKTASPKKEHARHFSALNRLSLSVGPGAIICLANDTVPITESVWAIPVGSL